MNPPGKLAKMGPLRFHLGLHLVTLSIAMWSVLYFSHCVPPSFTLYTQCTEPHGIAKGVYESYDPEELSFQVCIQIIEYMYINLISLHRRVMLLSYWSMLMSTGTWLGMLIMMIKRA